MDVFATSSSSVEMRLSIMKELSEIWGIPISSANTLFPIDKPLVQVFIFMMTFISVPECVVNVSITFMILCRTCGLMCILDG